MDSLDLSGFEMHDIKEKPVTEEDLELMSSLAGSYESLFSRRAQLYKDSGLKDKSLTENDYKNLILEHYTFLQRPVFIDGDRIFTGSSSKVKKALEEAYS